MYEAEVNRVVESIDSLPPAVVEEFGRLKGKIAGRTVLPWGEHCTECNWPVCYTSCELFAPRLDGNCRQFVDGTVRLDYPDAANSYVTKIRFKQWGKLWTVGNIGLQSPEQAIVAERKNIKTGNFARSVPLPGAIKRRVLGKVSYRRRLAAEVARPSAESADCFVVECYNPNPRTIMLTLTARTRFDASKRPFQTAIQLPTGFTCAQVPFADIVRAVDLKQPFEVEIVPNDCDNTVLYFGLVDFVKLAGNGKKWKCIVWDLDNTLWEGTLIEDGPEKIRLRQAVVEVIKETDRRGILHSVASKNNADDTLKVLRMFGLEEYFLHPQIGWQPKSQSIAEIARLLNIGVDALAFVDDQPFEREEVKAALPAVAVIDAAQSDTLPDRPECRVPVTEESRQRRALYRQQERRAEFSKSFDGDYRQFLKSCDIQLSIAPLAVGNLDRVYELAQRTNQMNFSGNRYPRAQLQELMQSKTHECFVMKCTDRFGDYGTVGFAVVDLGEPRLLDLMFSCRVQAKRVEHAVLAFLTERFQACDLFANYRKTPKNEPSGRVFEELGFEVAGESDGVTSLVFRKGRPILHDDIIHIST